MIINGCDIWNSSSLEHYGVKGMKWGVRHDLERYDKKIAKRRSEKQQFNKEMDERPFKNTKLAKAYRAASNKYFDKRIALTKKSKTRFKQRYDNTDYAKAKSMSNQELQDYINRINLEQNYINAVQRDKSAYRDATDSVLRKWGRRTTKDLYNAFTKSGSSAVDIGGQLTRNAVINSINKTAPITRKPKK